ncbi:MAG: 4Fe-4S binding protein [Rectinemataceae bacterium]
MASRQIIEIDQTKCNGCGACTVGCPEGALRVIGGKARLVGESLCDGLGACIGNCPLGAIKVTVRDADAYDERKVVEGIIPQGSEVLKAHLEHLDRHGQDLYIRQALGYLREKGISAPAGFDRPEFSLRRPGAQTGGGCPGSHARLVGSRQSVTKDVPSANLPDRPSAPSALSQWPIQLHLVNPRSGHFADADILVAADCTAFSMGSFHRDLLEGKRLLIACPKLDSGREIYVEKLAAVMEQAKTFSLAIMEVPCCSGLVKLALEARERCGRTIPFDVVILGIEGGFIARRTY